MQQTLFQISSSQKAGASGNKLEKKPQKSHAQN